MKVYCKNCANQIGIVNSIQNNGSPHYFCINKKDNIGTTVFWGFKEFDILCRHYKRKWWKLFSK